MSRYYLISLLLLLPFGVKAQVLSAHRLGDWGIAAANYSGITPLGDGRYAVVSDKETQDGFYVWNIEQGASGDISQVSLEKFYGQSPDTTDSQGYSKRDAEDIVYVPQRGTFFITGEGDQRIMEWGKDGKSTGMELSVPSVYKNIYGNYGFEALAYDTLRQVFYTTTENCLKMDGKTSYEGCDTTTLLRIQSFDAQLQPLHQYAYLLDAPQCKSKGRSFSHGVVAMAALPDGRLAVLEREAHITQDYNKSKVWNRLYLVSPTDADTITFQESAKEVYPKALKKQSVANWTTRFSFLDNTWANFEGMCLGQPTSDGRQTLIMVSDSQGGFGLGPFRLRDWIRAVVLPNE